MEDAGSVAVAVAVVVVVVVVAAAAAVTVQGYPKRTMKAECRN